MRKRNEHELNEVKSRITNLICDITQPCIPPGRQVKLIPKVVGTLRDPYVTIEDYKI